MFKKFWLPTQKGASASFPDTTKSPTALRIRGVEPGSEMAQAIVHRFEAQISHFHRTQMQKYSLSTIENYRAHGQYPGLKMTYTNLHGQETLDIWVQGKVLEELEKKLPRRVPDFVVVDLHVPDANDLNDWRFLAIADIPPAPDTDEASDLPWRGIAANGFGYGYDDGTEHPFLAYPNPEDSHEEVVMLPELVSSLKVDLRRFGQDATLRIKLYGIIGKAENQLVLTGYRQDTLNMTVEQTQTYLGEAEEPTTSIWPYPPGIGTNWYGFYPAVTVADMPAPLPPPATSSPTITETLHQHTPSGLIERMEKHSMVQVIIPDSVPLRWQVYDYYVDWRIPILPQISSISVPIPQSQPSPLKYQFYWDSPSFGSIKEESFVAAQWVTPPTASSASRSQFSMVTMTDDYVGEVDNNLDNKFRLRFLGNLIVDRATASVAFEPA